MTAVRLTHADLETIGRALSTDDTFTIVEAGGQLATAVERIVNTHAAVAWDQGFEARTVYEWTGIRLPNPYRPEGS